MKTSTFAIVLAAVAGVPGIAAANHHSFDGEKLAEVSADPRDGADVIPLPQERLLALELRAREAPVRIAHIELRLRDGRVLRPDVHGRILPGERELIQLPDEGCPIDSITIDYGRQWADRTPARLEVYGIEDTRRDARARSWYEDRDADRYDDRYEDRRATDRDDAWRAEARIHRGRMHDQRYVRDHRW